MIAKGNAGKSFVAPTILIAAWLSSFTLACFISAESDDALESDNNILKTLFGTASSAIGDELYEMADRYYHRGVGHLRHVHTNDIFMRTAQVVTPVAHSHLKSGRDMLEVMPWLRFATRMDPGNIEAYAVALHWLLREGMLEEAREVLREALDKNPEDYRVYLEGGLFYLRASETARAARYLDRSLLRWPRPHEPESEDALHDLGTIYSYRSFIYQLEGKYEQAAKMLRQEYELFPQRTALAETIARLEMGEIDHQQLDRVRKIIARNKFEDAEGCSDQHEH